MDHLIGQRFSLISKSEIRYVGILHEINPEQSTIALEEVFSFGTEDRRVDNYIPPSTQKFEYIVFRGSDVKDIKIAEDQQEQKPPTQPPNDPAILNSSRPHPSQPPPGPSQSTPQAPPAGPAQGPPQGPPSNRGESPFPPSQNYPPPPPPGQYGGFYPPPPPGQFGRGYGPPPGAFGPGPGFPPYGPPPGYFGPPGQHFPPGPHRFPPQQQAPPPIGPPGQRPPVATPQQQAPAPSDVSKPTPELPDEKVSSRSGSKASTPAPNIVAQPAKPSKPADLAQTKPEPPQHPSSTKQPPTMPKSNRVTPAMPFVVNQKSFTPPAPQPSVGSTASTQPISKPAPSQIEMDEASRQAKEAVAAAMAKLSSTAPQSTSAATTKNVEALAEKVSQLTTSTHVPSGPSASSAPRGRGNYRGGRGNRTSSGGQRQKLEIPQSDFDFESANAKFNKEDLIKEAIASGSPLQENPDTPITEALESTQNGTKPERKDSIPQVSAYNRSTSFFDNISSDSKDREDSQTVNGRALRGQEFKKNIETFGQGNVDSGYRGRGRGGYRGRGRGNSNYRGNYRGRPQES